MRKVAEIIILLPVELSETGLEEGSLLLVCEEVARGEQADS